MKQNRISAWLLISTGLLHNLIGLLMGAETLMQMHADGWISSADPLVTGHYQGFAMLWFELLGFFWIVLGAMMLSWCRHTSAALPGFLGISILAAGIIAAALIPASGAWLMIPQGWYIIRTANRHQRHPDQSEDQQTTVA